MSEGLIPFGPEPVVRPGTKLHVMAGGRDIGEMMRRPTAPRRTACGRMVRHGISLPDDPARVSHDAICRNCLRATFGADVRERERE